MAERLTWKEIKEKYPHQWVGMTDVEWKAPDNPNVKTAVVKYTDKDMNELLELKLKEPDLYSLYTTPDDEPFVGFAWVVRNAKHNSKPT